MIFDLEYFQMGKGGAGQKPKQGSGQVSKTQGAAKKISEKQASRFLSLHTTDPILAAYGDWAVSNNFMPHPKVTFSSHSVSGRGMIAVDDIQEGEVLFQIPRSMLLSPSTCSIAKTLRYLEPDEEAGFHDVTEGSDESSTSDDDVNESSKRSWAALLIALMVEWTTDTSKWTPYLKALPRLNTLTHPHFWPAADVAKLAPVGLCQDITQDLQDIEHEYRTVVLDYMHRNPGVLDPAIHTLEMYTRLATLVMSYSFTDDTTGGVAMIPVADLLNHRTGCNNARLFYGGKRLQMIAIKPIAAGDEVFNTYGELGNFELLRKYGFVEPAEILNPFDEVRLPRDTFLRTLFTVLDVDSAGMLTQRKLKFLSDRGFLKMDDAFYLADFDLNVDQSGDESAVVKVPVHPRLITTVQVMCLTSAQLDEFETTNPVALLSDDEFDNDSTSASDHDASSDGGEHSGSEEDGPPKKKLKPSAPPVPAEYLSPASVPSHGPSHSESVLVTGMEVTKEEEDVSDAPLLIPLSSHILKYTSPVSKEVYLKAVAKVFRACMAPFDSAEMVPLTPVQLQITQLVIIWNRILKKILTWCESESSTV